MQPRGDEAPQLIEPHGGSQDDPGDSSHLHLQDERVGHTCQCEGDIPAFGPGLIQRTHERSAEPGEQLCVVDPADDHAQGNGNATLDEAGTQLPEMVGQRHRR